MNMNVLPEYNAFFRQNFIREPDEAWGEFATLAHRTDKPFIDEEILNLLAVKYILIPKAWDNHQNFFRARKYPVAFEGDRVTVFENVNRYPRIFAVSALIQNETIPNSQMPYGRAAAFSEDAQLLELARREGLPNKVTSDVQTSRDFEHVKLLRYGNTQVVADADLALPSVVVLMDNWYPNWKAYVDDKEVYVGIVNKSFRGIILPAGKHRIEMRYRPATLTAALWITFVVVGLIIALFIARRRLDPWLRRLQLHELPA
jgi:hypothetical protein